ncbi:hypothetical protein G6L41_008630 [Agrobacterium tumefaciens]|uniref:glycine-rich domain-containing protein n=1 Tax=Agrobacterium tumefaciens TaxID=358 RepID=UPI001572AE1F|nr:hypothetical protein [Agrobacterium tumefaciens]WCK12334.1 hypothetical protein G6L41_008630 [Agrobacterium tumefaciens]
MKYHAPYGSADPDASYVDKNVPGAVRGSPVPAAAIEDPQREIVDFITKSGLVPADERQLARAVQAGKVSYCIAGGTAAAITATLSPVPDAYREGMRIKVKLAASIPGACTINVNGLGAKNITRSDLTPLKAGDGLAGQVLDLVYDGTRFQVAGLLSSAQTPSNVQVFTVAGTSSWVVPAGVTRVVAEVIGGGGGSGGAGTGNHGAGGGGGGYASKFISGLVPGDSISVTVGAGGAAGALNGGNGGQGGTSSFGPYVSATGGAGGVGNTTNGANGGGGVGGDININGQGGNGGSTISSSALMGGGGGGAPNGGAGRQFGITSVNGAFNGFPGVSPGGGASGGASTSGSAAPVTGAVGAPGQVVIRW